MAGAKQKLTVEIDVQAKINQAQEAINKLTKGMSDAFSVKGNAGIIKDTVKIQEAMKQLAALTSKPMDLLDFKNADKQIKTVENLISGLEQDILAFQQGNKDYQFKFINTKDLDQGKVAVKEYLTALQKIKDKEEELSNQKIEVDIKNENLKQAGKDADDASKKIKAMSDAWTKLKSAQGQATKAQDEYNKTVEASGKDSDEAKEKLDQLEKEKQLVVELAQAYNEVSGAGIKDVDYKKASTLKTFADDSNYQAKIDAQQKIIDSYDQVEAVAVSAEAKLVELQNSFNDMTMVDAKPFDILKQKLKDIGLEIKDLDQKIDLSESEWAELFEAIKQGRFEEVKKTFNELGISLGEIQQQVGSLGENVNTGNISLQGMTDDANRSAQAIDNLKNKITQLTGLTGSVLVLRKAFQQAWQTVQELDKTMTETAVVTDFTVGDMWDQLPEYAAKAKELGIAINDVYEASTLYYQQGLKTNEVNAVTTQTLKMARIAGLDAAEATDRMTNALRGFNKQFTEINETNATTVADVYSKLAAITASNVDEISTAMTKVASLANSANMSFENTAAFLSQIIETTRESAETAGTALKTIVARFSEIKENPAITQSSEGDEIDYNNIDKALKSVGISMDAFMKGQEGLDQVLMRLAEKWDTLSVTTQRYIATQAAGSRQQSRFIALMSDYARTQELVNAANNATGASAAQYAKTTESLQTKLANLKTEWEKFTMSIMNSDFLKSLVDTGTQIMQFINDLTGDSGLGKIAVVVGGLTAAKGILSSFTKSLQDTLGIVSKSEQASSGIGTFVTSLNGLITNGPKFFNFFTEFKEGWGESVSAIANNQGTISNFATSIGKSAELFKQGASGAKIFGSALKGALPQIIAITIAITALVHLYNKFSFNGLKQTAEDASKNLENANSKLEDTNSQLQEINESIDALKAKGPLSFVDNEELEGLEKAKEILLLQKALQEKEQKEAIAKNNQAQQNVVNRGLKRMENTQKNIKRDFDAGLYGDITWEELINSDAYKKSFQSDFNDTLTAMLDIDTSGFTTKELEEYSNKLDEILKQGLETDQITGSVYLDYKIDGNKQSEYNKQFTELLKENSEISEEEIKKILGNDFDIYLEAAGGDIDKLTEHVKSYAEVAEKASKQKFIDTSTFKGATTDLNKIKTSISSLQKAFEDFDENGRVSSETIADISEQFTELKITDFEDSLKDLANASNLSELQKALNNITTQFLNSNEVLNNLSDSTKNYYTEELKSMGVQNAEILVQERLNEKKVQEAFYNDATAASLVDLQKTYGDTTDALYLYTAQQILLEKQDLTQWANNNIGALSILAESIGVTTEYLTKMSKLQSILNSGGTVTWKDIADLEGWDAKTLKEKQSVARGNGLTAKEEFEYLYDQVEEKTSKARQEALDKLAKLSKTSTNKDTSTSYWENPLEKHYQLLKDINKEQRNLNKLQHDYELSIMTASGYEKDSLKQRELLQKQMESQLNQLKQQESLMNAYAADKQEIINTYGSTYAEYFRKDSSGNIIGLNEQAWANTDNLIKSDSELAETLDKIYELWTNAESGFEEAEDAIMDIESDLADQRSQSYDDYWDLVADTIDLLVEKEEKYLELKQEEIDNEQAANEALISTIRSNFQQLRQDRQNEKTEDEIADLTKKIAYLKQDTTGGNATQIKELERQLAEKKESYTDTLIDQAIDYEEQINENNIEYQQKMQDYAQADLEYKKKTNYFEEQAIELINQMMDPNKGAVVENSKWFELFKQINGDTTTGELYKKQKSMESTLTKINNYLPGLFGSVEQVIAGSKNPSTLLPQTDNNKDTGGNKTDTDPTDTNPSGGDNNTQTDKGTLTADSDEAIGIAAAILNSSTKSGWGRGEERKTKLNEKFTNGYDIVQGIIDEDSKNNYKKLNKFAASHDLTKYYYTAFATGGLADFTGPAWLDGTKSNPEIVLNAKDSENFIQLRDVLRGLFDGVATNNTSIGDSYFDIDVNVDSIASSYDLDQIAEDIKYSIYKDASYRNINNISTLK